MLGLTPNGLYILLCLKEHVQPKLVDVPMEMSRLERDGFLQQGLLSPKAVDAIEQAAVLTKASKRAKKKFSLSAEDVQMIEQYRLLFPSGRLPSGAPSRVSVRELTPRFVWFFQAYPLFYDWKIVLPATALYVDEYEPNGYEFMRNSEYFIYKQDVNKVMKSVLADYCQLILDGVDEEKGGPSVVRIPGL